MHNLTWQEKVEINLEALLNTNKAMLERIERLEETQYEYLGVAPTAPVKYAPAPNWQELLSNLANDELPAAIASNLTAAMREGSVQPPDPSPSEPSYALRELESSMFRIAAAVSARQGTPLPEKYCVTPELTYSAPVTTKQGNSEFNT